MSFNTHLVPPYAAQVQASDLRRMGEIARDVLREKEDRIVGLKEVTAVHVEDVLLFV